MGCVKIELSEQEKMLKLKYSLGNQMKNKFKKIIPIVLLLFFSYLLGNLFPLANLFPSVMPFHLLFPFPTLFQSVTIAKQGDIRGDTGLKVIVLKDNGQPVPNLYVDVGTKEGQPPLGGEQLTGKDGVALFTVKPGIYRIWFDKGFSCNGIICDPKFPSNLQYPDSGPPIIIDVVENKVNQQTIIMKSK